MTGQVTNRSRWEIVALREVCAFRHGGTPSKAIGSYWQGSIPWVSPKDMRSARLEHAQDAITEEAIRDSSTSVVPADTVLVVIRSGILARTFPIAVTELPVAFNQDIKALLPLPDRLDSWFLYWLLRYREPEILSRGVKKGATVHSLRSGFLESLSFALPPLSEQLRIASDLEHQMAAVERARASAEARAEAGRRVPQAYLRRAFRGITPLAVGTRRDAPPAGWRWRRLTELARLETGHTPSRYHPEWWGGTIPWISLPDIRQLDGKVAFQTAENTNGDGIANSSARVLPANTVVLSRTASVGFVTVMGREMATSQDFVNWVCGEDLHPRFLLYLLMRSRAYIRSLSSGAIHQTVYMPTVEAFEVCVPERELQESLAASLTESLQAASTIRQGAEDEAQAIDALAGPLLRQAFSSQL